MLTLLITLDLLVGCILGPMWYAWRYKKCYLKGGFKKHSDLICACGDDTQDPKLRDGKYQTIGYSREKLDKQWRHHSYWTYTQCILITVAWPVGVALAVIAGTIGGTIFAAGFLIYQAARGFGKSFVFLTGPVRRGLIAFWKLPTRKIRQQIGTEGNIYLDGKRPANVPRAEDPTTAVDTNGVKYLWDGRSREWTTTDGINHMKAKVLG